MLIVCISLLWQLRLSLPPLLLLALPLSLLLLLLLLLLSPPLYLLLLSLLSLLLLLLLLLLRVRAEQPVSHRRGHHWQAGLVASKLQQQVMTAAQSLASNATCSPHPSSVF
jgi:hypothetical protein